LQVYPKMWARPRGCLGCGMRLSPSILHSSLTRQYYRCLHASFSTVQMWWIPFDLITW
jgi:hypothetical protein